MTPTMLGFSRDALSYYAVTFRCYPHPGIDVPVSMLKTGTNVVNACDFGVKHRFVSRSFRPEGGVTNDRRRDSEFPRSSACSNIHILAHLTRSDLASCPDAALLLAMRIPCEPADGGHCATRGGSLSHCAGHCRPRSTHCAGAGFDQAAPARRARGRP